jgi:hypothetical protein
VGEDPGRSGGETVVSEMRSTRETMRKTGTSGGNTGGWGGGKYEEIRGRKKERDTYRKIQGNAERSAMIDRTRSMGDLGKSGENTERSGMRGRRDTGISGIRDTCGGRSRRRNCGIRNETYKGNHEKNG